MPALQCCRVSAVELSPPAPVSSEVQLGAVLAGHWSGEEATGGRSVAEVCVSNLVVSGSAIRDAARLSSWSMDLLSLTVFIFSAER